jgi:hypothetical protein
MKQNTSLYDDFKKKYEDAMQLFQQMDQSVPTRRPLEKKGSYYDHHSPFGKEYSVSLTNTDQSVDESPVVNIYRSGVKNTEFNINEHKGVCLSNKKKVDFLDFEKLKEDYFNLYEEKRNLESQVVEYAEQLLGFNMLKDEFGKLKVLHDIASDKLNTTIEDKVTYHERLNKVVKENSELLQTVHNLKEHLNNSEREKNNIKTKLSTCNNKFKLIEKELNISKKKCQTLNFQIKNLTEKLNIEADERVSCAKLLDDLRHDYNNKLATLEVEKQKLTKDPFMLLMKSLEDGDNKLIELVYNNETNKIEMYWDGSKIMELDNNKRKPFKSRENSIHFNNGGAITPNLTFIKPDPSPFATIENKENFFGCSPKRDYPISLMKLFSKSSNKSFFNSAASHNKPSIIDIMPSHFSSEKGVFDYNEKMVTKFEPNADDGLENCIKNTALNNMKYVFTAGSNRFGKLISLQEDNDEEVVKSNAHKTPTFSIASTYFSLDRFKKPIDYYVENTADVQYCRDALSQFNKKKFEIDSKPIALEIITDQRELIREFRKSINDEINNHYE